MFWRRQNPSEQLIKSIADNTAGSVEQLLMSGADANARDKSGVPALAVAASYRQADIVRSLLRHGADPKAIVEGPKKGYNRSPVILFPSGNGSLEVLDALLDAGADPNAGDATGLTPLMSAAFMGHDGILRRLIAWGAVLENRDDRGYTALMFACNGGKLFAVTSLLRAGADVNASDKDGSTPLMFASQHGHDDVVRAMLLGGADPTTVGRHGLSAVGLAEQNKLVSTLEILRGINRPEAKYGTSPSKTDDPNPMIELRRAVLTEPAALFGIRGANGTPWAVIMETGFPEGAVSLVCVADGNASLYFSSGGGVIGGFAHTNVRAAAIAFVRMSSAYRQQFGTAKESPLPAEGRTNFYVRVNGELLRAEASEDDLGEDRHALSKLFHSGHNVITQLRLISETSR